jgi:hypothetical protein
LNPYNLLRDAIRAVPAMKYALAVAGLGAVVAIVLGLRLSPQVAVFGALIVLGLMFILVIFTGYASQGRSALAGPAAVLVWFYTFAVIIATALFMTNHFFNWPTMDTARGSVATNASEVKMVGFHRTIRFKGGPFNIAAQPALNFGFSSLERDASFLGKDVKVNKIEVTVASTNHSDQICCDIWVFLGPAPVQFPEGATTVSQVGSYPWDINRDVPTQVKLNVGRPGSDTGSYSYHVTYDYSDGACIVEPTMGFTIKSSLNQSMTLPNGLYAQVLVWTGFQRANLDVRVISVHIEGTMPAAQNSM